MSHKGQLIFDLRTDTSYNLTTYIDVYGDQGKGGRQEDDDTQNLDTGTIQCGVFHHHYQDLYACATTGNIFLINMATGTLMRTYSLQGIGVVKQMLFVSPIRRVVRRVARKGENTVIFDQPCFYNPCLDDLYIAFIVQYPLSQSTTLYLLDLSSPIPELYQYVQSDTIISIATPVSGIQMNVTTAPTVSEVESKPFGEQYSVSENGRVPYMVIALSMKYQVCILSFLAPMNLIHSQDSQRSPLEFCTLQIASPIQLANAIFIAFGSKPWNLFICKGSSVFMYNLELAKQEGNRDTATNSALKWVEDQRMSLLQYFHSRRASMDAYFLDNFAAYTAISESLRLPFNNCKLALHWTLDQSINKIEQLLLRQGNMVAITRNKLLKGHALEIKAISIAPATDYIALATEAFVLLFSISLQKILAVLTYPTPESIGFISVTLNFISGIDEEGEGADCHSVTSHELENANEPDQINDIANLDDFDIFADEAVPADLGDSPSTEPTLKKVTNEPTLSPLTRDAIQRLMSMPCILDTAVLSDISTSTTSKTTKNIISADLVSQDPYLYFMNESSVEVQRSETVKQHYKLVDFISRHKHMYPVFLSLYNKHIDSINQFRMDRILSKQLGAAQQKPAHPLANVPSIACKSVAFTPQLHVDLSLHQSFEFLCNGSRLVLASMCGIGRPVVWNLSGLDAFAEKYKSRENSTLILPGYLWSLAVLEEKDLSSANVCQFNPVSGFMIKNVGSQLRIYMPK
ncbi:hypothetical protein QR46_3748 [Giardia duodenalis assemblage B]|uniref:Uncharacterized protein n=2 Tax=Giardia intestinalis TaxID=5741 RepID=A0A132NQG1_GIAIN|nr:hypothetical protein QR46_3748 [Giardia intestinalis assemblage B]